MTTDTKLTSNINIALVVNASRLADLLDGVFVALPGSTAIDTFNRSRLASSPLLKTNSVDVLSASTFVPQNIFGLVRLIELHDTNGAVAFD